MLPLKNPEFVIVTHQKGENDTQSCVQSTRDFFGVVCNFLLWNLAQYLN